MNLDQAKIKAKQAAYIYEHWSQLFGGCHQPTLEDYLAQLIYETAQTERELCLQFTKFTERNTSNPQIIIPKLAYYITTLNDYKIITRHLWSYLITLKK
ncbi:MAG: hypothetical protein HXX20_00280 [Chloroflexi bacterium]|nr:hypothetical protein [Chloroflexota bacterium]